MAINFIRGNILSDNLVRGSNISIQSSPLSNRDVLFVDVVNGNVGVNTAAATHTLTVWGNCNIRDTVEAGNVSTPGDVSATGNVSGNIGNFTDIVVGNIDIGNIIGGGNLQVESITSNTFVSAVGDVVAGNVSAVGNISGNIGIFEDLQVGNIDLGNLVSGGNLQVESVTANLYLSSVGNITGGNLLTSGEVSALGNVTGGNINSNGDISAAGNITANNFSGIGNISLGNLTISNTTISTSLANGNITLTPTGNTLVIIDTSTGLVIPVGNIDQRPTSPLAGTLRFNSDIERMEIYDGAEWDPVVSEVTNQILYGDNSTLVFTLDRSTTAAAVLIMFNGIVQLPNVAYTIAGNTVTFAQAPAVSDIIDVRFL